MDKETLLKILELSKTKNISEKEANRLITGKYESINYWKGKYGIEKWKPGESPHCKKERDYNVNDNYFEKITEVNSYYAGFIAADGNVSKDNRLLTIVLAEKDSNFLENFLQELESDYKVHHQVIRNKYPAAGIQITSNKIVEDLKNNFNIVPNKSLIYSPPKLEKSFLDCFIMGIIDGDGTIGYSVHDKSTQPALYISFVGTKDSVIMVKTRFEEILGKSTSNLFQRDLEKNFYSYRISDKNAREIFIYFYENYNYLPTLNRKWTKEIYEYCINWTKKLPTCRRKGVKAFNLKGELIGTFDTLKDCSEFTKVEVSRISNLCKINDNKHMSNGYMFTRDEVDNLPPYEPSKSINIKYLNKEQKELDKGETNVEDEA